MWTMVLAIVPVLTTALFLLPVIVGLLGTWLPAFGYFPALGMTHFSITPWIQLANYPGIDASLLRTLVSGWGASLLALLLTLLLLIGAYPSRLFQWIEKSLSPILSVPHAAFAIGLGFLLTPSGWIVRVVHGFSGLFDQPPVWTTFQDPTGISLAITLALKELPFLLFMSLAVLPTIKAQQTLWLMRSMGHSRRYTWFWILFPQLYKQIKLPFFAVLVYSLTVVDIALIAGPTVPPSFAVLITQLFEDPFLESRTIGAAGATLLLGLVIATLVLTQVFELAFKYLRKRFIARGVIRKQSRFPEQNLAYLIAGILSLTYIAAFAVTLLWSISKSWRYPDILPESFFSRSWERVLNRIDEPLWCTFLLAILSAGIALLLVIMALENELRLKRLNRSINVQRILWLIYLPLLVPQIAFLFGFQVSLISIGFDGTFASLLWSHLVFVLPYVFLTLSGPYRKFDERYSWVALSLSRQPTRSYWQIKFPILLRPILYAFATGFSVSIAQYLPTIFIGAGKFSTITTETVAMASGSDRRMMAVMAIWQQSLPFVVFALATLIPVLLFRRRRAMR